MVVTFSATTTTACEGDESVFGLKLLRSALIDETKRNEMKFVCVMIKKVTDGNHRVFSLRVLLNDVAENGGENLWVRRGR